MNETDQPVPTEVNLEPPSPGPPICIYHDNCHDGITAAWVVRGAYNEVEMYPGRYDVEPDYAALEGRRIIMVDFSWKSDAMRRIAKAAYSLLVLDHHQSAERELAGLDDSFFVKVVFDVHRSGAGLAWDWFHRNEDRPRLVDLVEDRDLWRFRLPESKAINAVSNSLPMTLEQRCWLLEACETDDGFKDLVRQGEAILRFHEQLVESATKFVTFAVIGGMSVPCVACSLPQIISDVAHKLAEGAPYAAAYTLKDDGGVLVSLRSRQGGTNVAKIAEKYGGGGHANAAGFHLENWSDLILVDPNRPELHTLRRAEERERFGLPL